MNSSPVPVTDLLSNFNDQLVTAARLVGRSKRRQEIFKIIYTGKRQVKTINEIARQTGMSQTHVLKEGGKMAGLLIEKVTEGYKKKKEFSTRYRTILAIATDKKKLKMIPTKVTPTIGDLKVNVQFPAQAKNAIFITIDDIDSFSLAKGKKPSRVDHLGEEKIKEAFKKIIGEDGVFKDWGGERSDLYSTRIVFKGKRVSSAIAFKGKGTIGKLVPAKMGKNGDQINRLFTEPAELFLVVYGGQVDSAIISQMQAFAIGVAVGGRKIYYGIVDGNDLGRLISAFPSTFR